MQWKNNLSEYEMETSWILIDTFRTNAHHYQEVFSSTMVAFPYRSPSRVLTQNAERPGPPVCSLHHKPWTCTFVLSWCPWQHDPLLSRGWPGKCTKGIQHVGGLAFRILADCVFYQEIMCWVNNDEVKFACLCESEKIEHVSLEWVYSTLAFPCLTCSQHLCISVSSLSPPFSSLLISLPKVLESVMKATQ